MDRHVYVFSTLLLSLQFELYGMDRIPVSSGDVIGVTNDADVGPVAVSYTTGPSRIYRRPISDADGTGRRADGSRPGDDRPSAPEVGKIYEFTVVPFALEFSLNADLGSYSNLLVMAQSMYRHDDVTTLKVPNTICVKKTKGRGCSVLTIRTQTIGGKEFRKFMELYNVG